MNFITWFKNKQVVINPTNDLVLLEAPYRCISDRNIGMSNYMTNGGSKLSILPGITSSPAANGKYVIFFTSKNTADVNESNYNGNTFPDYTWQSTLMYMTDEI